MLRFVSRLVALLALLAVLFALPALAWAQATDAAVAEFQKELTLDNKALDDIAQSLQGLKGDDATTVEALQTLKDSLDKTRKDLGALEDGIRQARKASQANIDQLGPVPKPSDSPEAKDKADSRQKEQALNQKLAELLTSVRQQISQADGLAGSFAIMPLQQTLAQNRKALGDVAARLAEIKDDDEQLQQKVQALRPSVDKTRADLVSLVSNVAQLREAARANLDKLGPKPKATEPPESKDVASARDAAQGQLDQLGTLLTDTQALIRQVNTAINAITTRPFEAAVAVDRRALDETEASIGALSGITVAGQVQQTLIDERSKVDKVRADLAAVLSTVTPLRDQSKARMPADLKPGDPPEGWDAATTRDKESSLLTALQNVVNSAQTQSNRADDLASSLIEHQRELITGQLFGRVESIFTAAFWKPVIASLPDTFDKAGDTVTRSMDFFSHRVNSTSIALFLLTVAIGYVVAQFLRFRITRWRARLPKKKKTSRRYIASLDAVLALVHTMLGLPCAVIVGVLAFDLSNLLPSDVIEHVGWDFIRASLIGVGLWALSRAILAKEHAELRMLPLSDWAVRRIGRRMSWLALVLGVSVLFDGIIKSMVPRSSLDGNAALIQARAGITAMLFIIITASLLIRLRSAPPTVVDGQPVPPDEDINTLDILRPMSWVAVMIMAVCLVLGYNILALAVAGLPLMLLCIIAATYLLTTLVDSSLTDNLLADADRRRAIASAIGITSKNVAFSATLLSGVIRFFMLIAAVLTLGIPFGFYSGDLWPMMQRAYFGFQVGGMTIAPSSILAGVILFGVIWVLTRLINGWMRNTLLPRTTFDSGLQNSIATIIGYTGVILAISLSLAETGVSLQNVAYVASALAVGIGFGLQAIINNFVSGLILLAERPIRVGDIIAAAGEEGYVRRISVRATEIETFDRATLIIPNSTLITGSVKNWVYGNTWSRLRLVLTLAYESDIDAVKAAMLGAAEDDPRILPTPPPRVYLAKIDSGLEFHLECMIASMETQPAVRSDLLTRILKTFRAKNIRLLAQGAAEAAPVVVHFDEKLQSAAITRLLAERTEAPASAPAAGSTPPGAP
ncbi:DUF3772 domain-containing protein [Labrys okinawensis]|uniref:DUF3772 domain-containing protein n=1 Tax=Labrys okinawensis TaxID=346911 RepID=UPI0039BC3512